MMSSRQNGSKGEILVVDDTHANLKLLMELLSSHGYKVRPASDGHQALEAITMRRPELVLLDIKMPGLDGYEVCRRLKKNELSKDIPVIFISALDALDDRIKGFEVGGVDYITKPFQREEVLARVQTHLQLYGMQMNLEKLVQERTEELLHSSKRLHSTLLQTIQVVALTLEKRDPYTAGHQQRVADLAAAVARDMRLAKKQIEGIKLGGLIHDIGKIYIPSEILTRPGRLIKEEFALIQTHPQVGYDIVKDIDFPWPVQQMILQHHERIDGSGYPNQLKGDEIILEARILAVVDVVEAMSSHRPYRPGLGIEAALDEIRQNSGRFYESDIVDCVIELFTHKDFKFDGSGYN